MSFKRLKLSEKIHIRCLFISKLKDNSTLYDLGLLTDNYQFFQCEIKMLNKRLSYFSWKKLDKMFKDFRFSKTTDVILTNNITIYEPIYFFIKII